MTFIELLPYLNNEEKAEEYLRESGILKKFETCIYCNSSSLGRIRRGKIKCHNCKREWNRRKGSIIERSRLDYSIIIMIIKLYSMGLSIFMISNETSKSKLSISPIIYEIRNKINLLLSINSHVLKLAHIVLKLDKRDKIVINQSLEKINNKGDNILIIIPTRKKNINFEYYYKFEVENQFNKWSLDDELQKFWIQNKNHLLSYTGRNVEELNQFLIEKIFRFNNRKGDLYKEIMILLRVADNIPYHKI